MTTTTSLPAHFFTCDGPASAAAAQAATPITSEPVRMITGVAAGLVRSADPVAVFGSLAAAFTQYTGSQCTVELLIGSMVSLIETASPSPAQACQPLLSEQPALSSVARQLLGGDGAPLSGEDWFALPIGAAPVRCTELESLVGCFTCRSRGRQAGRIQIDAALYLLSLATEVLEAERRLALAHNQVANLEIALKSNRDIGTATGILMNSHLVTQEQAFAMLRATSQHSHRKLREVANDVIFTGALSPTPPTAKHS